jgi:hypothetical protein
MQLKQKTKEILNRFKLFLITHKDILIFLSLVSLLGLILVIVSIANYYLLLYNNHNKKTSPKNNRKTTNSYFTETSTTYNTTNTSTTNNFTLGTTNSILFNIPYIQILSSTNKKIISIISAIRKHV